MSIAMQEQWLHTGIDYHNHNHQVEKQMSAALGSAQLYAILCNQKE